MQRHPLVIGLPIWLGSKFGVECVITKRASCGFWRQSAPLHLESNRKFPLFQLFSCYRRSRSYNQSATGQAAIRARVSLFSQSGQRNGINRIVEQTLAAKQLSRT
jgi:hypothetical protein